MATPDKYPELFKRLDTELFSETSEEAMTNALDYLNFKKWIEKNNSNKARQKRSCKQNKGLIIVDKEKTR